MCPTRGTRATLLAAWGASNKRSHLNGGNRSPIVEPIGVLVARLGSPRGLPQVSGPAFFRSLKGHSVAQFYRERPALAAPPQQLPPPLTKRRCTRKSRVSPTANQSEFSLHLHPTRAHSYILVSKDSCQYTRAHAARPPRHDGCHPLGVCSATTERSTGDGSTFQLKRGSMATTESVREGTRNPADRHDQ